MWKIKRSRCRHLSTFRPWIYEIIECIGQHWAEHWLLAKFQKFVKYKFALTFQYYLTVSGNLFPQVCLYLYLASCISSSFFHFLPVFSTFFRKKLEEIPFFQFLPFFPEETYFFRKFPNPDSGWCKCVTIDQPVILVKKYVFSTFNEEEDFQS